MVATLLGAPYIYLQKKEEKGIIQILKSKTDQIIQKLPDLIYESNPKLTIGFIQLPTDLTLDIEIPPILSQIKDVKWRMQKIYFKEDNNEITEETYKNAQNNIKKAVQVFEPIKSGYGKLDIIITFLNLILRYLQCWMCQRSQESKKFHLLYSILIIYLEYADTMVNHL